MTVTVILMRHGEAEAPAAPDRQRNLTAFGRSQVAQAAARLQQRRVRVDRLLTSPYVRAQQTAAIVSEVLGCGTAAECPAVVPGGEPDVVIDVLSSELQGLDCGMVVMHQPIISRLIKCMTDIYQPMETASIAVMEADVIGPGCFELKCVI